MKILWASFRFHKPNEQEVVSLKEIFGKKIKIVIENKHFIDCYDLIKRYYMGGYNEIVFTGPLHIVHDLCDNGIYPLSTEMSVDNNSYNFERFFKIQNVSIEYYLSSKRKNGKIYWISRHGPQESQKEALREIYGNNTKIFQEKKRISEIQDIVDNSKEYDDIFIVGPLHMISKLCKNKVYPLCAKMKMNNNWEMLKKNGFNIKPYSSFERFFRVNNLEIEYFDSCPVRKKINSFPFNIQMDLFNKSVQSCSLM